MTKPSLKALVAEIADIVRPQVVNIEAGLPTTQDNYDKYMGIITILARNKPQQATIVALALLRAGANPHGVTEALKITFPTAHDELTAAIAVSDRS